MAGRLLFTHTANKSEEQVFGPRVSSRGSGTEECGENMGQPPYFRRLLNKKQDSVTLPWIFIIHLTPQGSQLDLSML